MAHSIFISLVSIKSTIAPGQAVTQATPTFKKYWENAVSTLKMSKLNQMLQEQRDNPKLIEPLLKAAIVIGGQMQVEEMNSGEDLLNLLRGQLTKHEVSD